MNILQASTFTWHNTLYDRFSPSGTLNEKRDKSRLRTEMMDWLLSGYWKCSLFTMLVALA